MIYVTFDMIYYMYLWIIKTRSILVGWSLACQTKDKQYKFLTSDTTPREWKAMSDFFFDKSQIWRNTFTDSKYVWQSNPVEEREGDEQDILRAARHVVRVERQVGEIYHSCVWSWLSGWGWTSKCLCHGGHVGDGLDIVVPIDRNHIIIMLVLVVDVIMIMIFRLVVEYH